jgi:hypothetical protein
MQQLATGYLSLKVTLHSYRHIQNTDAGGVDHLKRVTHRADSLSWAAQAILQNLNYISLFKVKLASFTANYLIARIEILGYSPLNPTTTTQMVLLVNAALITHAALASLPTFIGSALFATFDYTVANHQNMIHPSILKFEAIIANIFSLLYIPDIFMKTITAIDLYNIIRSEDPPQQVKQGPSTTRQEVDLESIQNLETVPYTAPNQLSINMHTLKVFEGHINVNPFQMQHTLSDPQIKAISAQILARFEELYTEKLMDKWKMKLITDPSFRRENSCSHELTDEEYLKELNKDNAWFKEHFIKLFIEYTEKALGDYSIVTDGEVDTTNLRHKMQHMMLLLFKAKDDTTFLSTLQTLLIRSGEYCGEGIQMAISEAHNALFSTDDNNTNYLKSEILQWLGTIRERRLQQFLAESFEAAGLGQVMLGWDIHTMSSMYHEYRWFSGYLADGFDDNISISTKAKLQTADQIFQHTKQVLQQLKHPILVTGINDPPPTVNADVKNLAGNIYKLYNIINPETLEFSISTFISALFGAVKSTLCLTESIIFYCIEKLFIALHLDAMTDWYKNNIRTHFFDIKEEGNLVADSQWVGADGLWEGDYHDPQTIIDWMRKDKTVFPPAKLFLWLHAHFEQHNPGSITMNEDLGIPTDITLNGQKLINYNAGFYTITDEGYAYILRHFGILE